MISSAYNSVLPENYDRVTYGQAHYNPMDAHAVSQWGNQPQPDKDSLDHSTPSTDDFNIMQSIMQGAMGMFQDANMASNL